MKLNELKSMIKEIINEEISDSKFYIYHVTKYKNLKSIAQSNFKLRRSDGLIGEGFYFTYGDPRSNSGGMDEYGDTILKYSIPKSDLSHFLILDKNIDNTPLEEKFPSSLLLKIKGRINSYIEEINSYNDDNLKRGMTRYYRLYEYFSDILKKYGDLWEGIVDLYNNNKLYQLLFLKWIDEYIPLKKYYKGVLYSTRGTTRFSTIYVGKFTGTNESCVVYDTRNLNFEELSRDGGFTFNPYDESEKVMSIEVKLKKNLVPPNTTFKKSFIKLQNSKNLILPKGLKIIGSLDLRNIPDLIIPDDLEVTNSLYLSPDMDREKIPSTIKVGSLKFY